jgi:hypothetical protein
MNTNKLIETMDKLYPFKRVKIPQRLIDKFNIEFDINLSEMVFIVDKELEINDTILWEFMLDGRKIIENQRGRVGK